MGLLKSSPLPLSVDEPEMKDAHGKAESEGTEDIGHLNTPTKKCRLKSPLRSISTGPCSKGQINQDMGEVH